jgi:hypothetical protein
MPNPNRRTPQTQPAGSRPASSTEQAVPECVVLLRRSRPPLGDLDQICQRSGESRLVLRPIPELQPVPTEPVSIRSLRQSVGIQLLRSQDPTVRVTPWQQHRTLGETLCAQQPAQRTSDAVAQAEPDTGHGRQVDHTPAGTNVLLRRRRTPGTHNQRRPHLGAGKPPSHRCLRPARDRRRDTAAHPRNRRTPGGDPSRSWVLAQRTRRPEQVLDLDHRRHHPRRHDTHPRHGIEYARRPRQPAPKQPARGRRLRRSGPAPNPGTTSESRGKITRLVISSQRGQALPDGEPLRARDKPPLHSGPTARQPHRGAARRQPTTPPACEANHVIN